MKIRLLCIGPTTYAPLKEAIRRYAELIPHYIPFEIKELPDIRHTRSLSGQQQKEAEGRVMLASVDTSDYLILLDERGRQYTSRQFSEFLSGKMVSHPGRLVLAVGGPYGFSDEVYHRANSMISMSAMTFPHELVRLFITEQIYRAMTILRGQPYHHD